MKFPPELHRELVDMMQMKGLESGQFSFVKRRGRIITFHRSTGSTFSFIRKDEMLLDEASGTFTNKAYYLISHGDSAEQMVESWHEVQIHYFKWLESLSANQV